MTVGEATRAARERAGLSIGELSRKSGVSPTTIGTIESDHSEPKLVTIEILADVLGISIDEYVGHQVYAPLPAEDPHDEDPCTYITEAVRTTTDKRKLKKRSYSEERAFHLWQAGHTDAEIASDVGVSRAAIQKWRDVLELPSTTRKNIDTKKYHLARMPDGEYVVLKDDDDAF